MIATKGVGLAAVQFSDQMGTFTLHVMSPASDCTAMRPTKRGPEDAAVLLTARGAGEGLGLAAGLTNPATEAPLDCRSSAGWLPKDSPAIAGSGDAGPDWAAPLLAVTLPASTEALPLLAAEVGSEARAGFVLGAELPNGGEVALRAPGALALLAMAATSADAPSTRASSGCSPVHSRTSCMTRSHVALRQRASPCVDVIKSNAGPVLR